MSYNYPTANTAGNIVSLPFLYDDSYKAKTEISNYFSVLLISNSVILKSIYVPGIIITVDQSRRKQEVQVLRKVRASWSVTLLF